MEYDLEEAEGSPGRPGAWHRRNRGCAGAHAGLSSSPGGPSCMDVHLAVVGESLALEESRRGDAKTAGARTRAAAGQRGRASRHGEELSMRAAFARAGRPVIGIPGALAEHESSGLDGLQRGQDESETGIAGGSCLPVGLRLAPCSPDINTLHCTGPNHVKRIPHRRPAGPCTASSTMCAQCTVQCTRSGQGRRRRPARLVLPFRIFCSCSASARRRKRREQRP